MPIAVPRTKGAARDETMIEVACDPDPTISSTIMAATSKPSKDDKNKREHVCPTCNRAFNRLEHLTRHQRSHTREKPFKCAECAREFARSDLLLRHRQKIHDQKGTKQSRRARSQSSSVTVSTESTKDENEPKQKRRRSNMTMKSLPARNMSFSGVPGNQASALYMPASAPATTTSFFNFNYPSPSSTSPSSTSAEFLDCTLNANYVNPADLFNTGSLSTPQNFATPASTTSTSSMIPPTPPFSTYLPSVAGSLAGSISGSSGHRISIDSSVFDISTLMNTLGDSNTQCPTIPDETNTAMLLDTSDTFSPPQLYDITSPASFTNDSGVNNAHCNTAFQFAWQSTSKSHGSDEYNTGLPFEPSTSAVSPMDIIMKQSVKLGVNNPFTPSALNSTQLFSAFPDSNDVFDLLIDDKDPSSYTKREVVDAMLRGNLIATAQSAGVVTPEMPAAVDLSTYVNAYWEFIHPHIPFFFKPAFVAQFVQEGVLLAMCSLGALTVGATQHSLSLNVCAKAIVKERRSKGFNELADVQGLLLCELFTLYHRQSVDNDAGTGVEDLVMAARAAGLCFEHDNAEDHLLLDPDSEWRRWGNNEERKRTMFAVYILTSLLYSVTISDPTDSQAILRPSDITLSLPCDEDIYSAPSPVAWKTLNLSMSDMPQFSEAFHSLTLTAKSNPPTLASGHFSMFGALVLIAAVNSEIHRQILHNEDNCVENSAVLQEKFEPALKAWEFAWRSHPHACLSAASSPFGPLSADSVPLLNLAYVRLFADTSRAMGVNQTIGDVFPFLTPEKGGMSNVSHRIRVLKAVGYAINSLYLSEWFVGVMGQPPVSSVSSPPKRNWSFVAPFAGLESAVVVGTWLDRLVQLRCPVRDPEAKFLGRMDRVFPNSGIKRHGSESRRIVDVWGVLSDDDVMRALPVSAQVAGDIRQKAEKWHSFFSNLSR